MSRNPCSPYPELLDQVHVGPLVLLHAALRDAGHVSSQRAIDQHTQHVQHCGEQLTGTARDRQIERGGDTKDKHDTRAKHTNTHAMANYVVCTVGFFSEQN